METKYSWVNVLRMTSMMMADDITFIGLIYLIKHSPFLSCFAGGEAMSPVSVIVTPGHVAMVTEDESYVLDALFEKRSQSARRVSRSDLERSRRQFEVKDLQKLTDIVTIVSWGRELIVCVCVD